MRILPFFASVFLMATPALAEERSAIGIGAELDLNLSAASVNYRNYPPSTWYGALSGRPATLDGFLREGYLCPLAPDGSPREITGSMLTGIGYSSRCDRDAFGTTTINYCKEYTNEVENSRVVNVCIGVSVGPPSFPPQPHSGE